MNAKIAIFASGSGTNAENIIRHFQGKSSYQVVLIVSNRQDAFVLERVRKYNVPSVVFPKADFAGSCGNVLACLKGHSVDFILLAGFLLRVPDSLLAAYPNRIVNIHPSLLPKYGGKGMYGERVHEAVVRAGEKESGITIHYVNGEYDSGDIIFQASCPVEPSDTPQLVAAKVHALEYKYYPAVVEDLLQQL